MSAARLSAFVFLVLAVLTGSAQTGAVWLVRVGFPWWAVTLASAALVFERFSFDARAQRR